MVLLRWSSNHRVGRDSRDVWDSHTRCIQSAHLLWVLCSIDTGLSCSPTRLSAAQLYTCNHNCRAWTSSHVTALRVMIAVRL